MVVIRVWKSLVATNPDALHNYFFFLFYWPRTQNPNLPLKRKLVTSCLTNRWEWPNHRLVSAPSPRTARCGGENEDKYKVFFFNVILCRRQNASLCFRNKVLASQNIFSILTSVERAWWVQSQCCRSRSRGQGWRGWGRDGRGGRQGRQGGGRQGEVAPWQVSGGVEEKCFTDHQLSSSKHLKVYLISPVNEWQVFLQKH